MSNSRSPRYALYALTLLLFCLVMAANPVAAQTAATTGQIAGTVRDAQGAVVPNATVTVSNPATGRTQTLTTNEEGNFRALQLQPGNYTLTVNAPGFGTFTQTGYIVEVGSSLTANVTLSVTEVNEEVLVTSANVETTQVQTPAVINRTAIENLPINGRRFQDFVLLTPTAQTDPVRNQISLVGQRGINANVQIDGADYNQPFFGGIRGGERSNNAFTIPQSSIREFQVVPAGFNAEFGRSTGGVVNVVTQSGSNNYNGNLFVVTRPDVLAHRNAFGQIAAPTQTQYGGGFGGPIVRDRFFFFVSGERQHLSQQRAVLFTVLPANNPNPRGAEAFDFYRSLEGPYTQTNDANAFLTRFDWNINQSNQFNIRYNFSNNYAANAVTAGTSLTATTNSALSNNGTEGDRQHTVVGQLNTFFGPTVVNELRAQYSREDRPRTPNEISPLVNNGIGSFGTVSFLPTTQYDYRIQIADSVTWTRGNHTFKFGGEYNYTFADQLFAFNQPGNFFFSGLGTSAADVSALLGILSVGGTSATSATSNAADPINRFDDTRVRYQRAIGNGLANLSSNELAFYMQDSWRIWPNFTLYYGLRYEAQLFSQPDTSNSDLTNLVRNTNLPLGRIDPGVIPNQTNQWAPRLGFAWDPFSDGRTVFRAYSGIYYARTPLLTLAGPINNFRTPPGDVRLVLPSTGLPANLDTVYEQFLSIGINLNNFPLNALPILTVQQVQQINANIAAATGRAFDPLVGLQLLSVGDQLRNPRSFQFGGAFEREVARGLTLGVTFDYVNTVNLNRNRDYNLPLPIIRTGDRSLRPFFGISTATPAAFAQQRPLTRLGNSGFLQIREASARSLFRAVTFRAQMRRRWGQFDAFYVLGKSLDDDSTERNATFAEYDNTYNLQPEYSFSRNDRRHQFVFNTVFNVPFGFQIGTTGRFLSGAPIDVSVSGIVAPAGSGLSNAQYAAQVTLSGNTTGDLNQDAGNFSDRPYTAPGVPLPRNAFRNRPLYNTDIRIQRAIRFGEERYELLPTFEVFNVFKFKNITYSGTVVTNYGNPGVNERTGDVLGPSNPTFLRIRDPNTGNYLLNNIAGAPLQIQLGLRFRF